MGIGKKASVQLETWLTAFDRRRRVARLGAGIPALGLMVYLLITKPTGGVGIFASSVLLVVTLATSLTFRPVHAFLASIPGAAVIGYTSYLGNQDMGLAIGTGIGVALSAFVVSTLGDVNHRLREAESEIDRQQSELVRSFETSNAQLKRQRALFACANALLVPGEETSVDVALLRVAEATGADAAAIWKNEDIPESGLVARQVGWASTRETDVESPPPSLSWSRFPNMMTRISSGSVFSFTSRSEVPYPDRAGFELNRPIEAAIDVPVMVDGHWSGMVSAFSLAGRKQWSTEDVSLLNTIANMIAAWWAREETVVRLHELIGQRDHSLELQTALIDASRTLLEQTEDNPVTGVLEIIRTAVGADIAYLADFYDDELVGPAVRRTSEVTSSGISTVPAEPVSWSARPYAFEALAAGRPYVFDNVRDLPDRERRYYSSNNDSTNAEIAFPVLAENRILAIVGVGSFEPRSWTPSEIRTIGTVARMLAAQAQRAKDQEALEGLVIAKDRFIASVSHELRTPMAVVMGLSSELATRRSDFTEAEVTEFIDLIARQSMDVSHIIEDLLVSTRVQEVGITVIPEPMRLDDQVREVLADLPQEYTFKISTIELEPALVLADPRRVRQVVRNLITNSHRHGGDEVKVTVRNTTDTAELIVADNGPGLSAEQKEHLFEAYSAFSSNPGRPPTIGLGLNVSFQLARLMNGSITYQSDPSPRFILELPMVSAGEVAESVKTR